MKREILLGTMAVALMGLGMTACAHKKKAMPEPAPVAVAQPAAPQPVSVSQPAPTAETRTVEAKRLDYVRK